MNTLLDARMKASLDWKSETEAARKYVENGSKIFWDMDLGLFSRLDRPLSNQTQFQTFCLSLEHFRDTLWKEFKDQTIGLGICSMDIDFSKGFPWDEEQLSNWHGWLQDHFDTVQILNDETGSDFKGFEKSDPRTAGNVLMQHVVRLYCRDALAEYLGLLVARLPDALPIYTTLKAGEIKDPLFLAQLSARDRFDRLNLELKNFSEPFSLVSAEANVAICLPSIECVRPSHCAGLREAMEFLKKLSVPFRIIPESLLITEWDGLDDLIYSPAGLSYQGRRKLQGFCAAGGRLISTGPLLGLPYEIDLQEYMMR